jgi:hypothetical protein
MRLPPAGPVPRRRSNLSGGSSVRRTQRRTLDPQQLQQAVDHRHQRCTLRRIAKALKAPLATVGRVMNALGLGRLRNLESRKPGQRYQWERPGDMIHVDTKQLARFERVGSGDVESWRGSDFPWAVAPSISHPPRVVKICHRFC